MSRGHNQEVGNTSLLTSDEDGRRLVPVEDGEWPDAGEVVAEGAGVGIRHH